MLYWNMNWKALFNMKDQIKVDIYLSRNESSHFNSQSPKLQGTIRIQFLLPIVILKSFWKKQICSYKTLTHEYTFIVKTTQMYVEERVNSSLSLNSSPLLVESKFLIYVFWTAFLDLLQVFINMWKYNHIIYITPQLLYFYLLSLISFHVNIQRDLPHSY